MRILGLTGFLWLAGLMSIYSKNYSVYRFFVLLLLSKFELSSIYEMEGLLPLGMD
jgi:hypothetical protein